MSRRAPFFPFGAGGPPGERPIVSAPGRPPPRVPDLPSAPYAPPQVRPPPLPQPPVVGRAESYEAVTKILPVEQGITAAEVDVYTTEKRWRACDVYVDPPQGFLASSYLRVRVYALSQDGGRTLVTSGYLSFFAAASVSPLRARRWAAAARAVSERFVVTIQPIGMPAVGLGNMRVTVVASDEATTPPPDVGVAPAFATILGVGTILPRAGAPPAASDPSYNTEIYSAQVFNDTAGVLWFQVLDDVTVGGGALPILSFLLPASTGLLIGPEFFRGIRFGALGCVVGGSTTPGAFAGAAPGDMRFQVWIR